MIVRVHLKFESPTDCVPESLLALARSLTNDPRSVQLVNSTRASTWLTVEFTMPTEAQYKAVEKIDRAIRFHAGHYEDSVIQFPKSAAERERNRRKGERRRERKRASRDGQREQGEQPDADGTEH